MKQTETYIGNELELFKEAHNWKKYYSSKIIPFIKGDVLEVGAGIGETTKVLFNNNVDSWTCLEPDPVLVSEIKSKIDTGYISKNTFLVTGIITDLEKDKLFDTIVYIDVLEHIENDSEEFKKAINKLKPNGHLIILVPAYYFLFNEFDKAIGHYRRYNKKMLKKLEINEIKRKKLFYLDSLGLIASLANKCFLKQENPTLKQVKMWDNLIIPFSKIFDILAFYSAGKSLIGVWKKNNTSF